ncbi:hypothetical protein ACO34A_01425 [Rhizobium sp. ACO-34A]|nr:hypothetical protein [Rhizobium sp. ACO-34A]ATN32471.1 hypothetical protein ACO34A_01425 [Rhizobium sp. ACO-34A]
MDPRSDTPDPDLQPGYGKPKQETLSATKARQGLLGKPVLIILLAGLILALLVWIPTEWWGSATAPENQSNQPTQQEAAPPPVPSNPPQQ